MGQRIDHPNEVGELVVDVILDIRSRRYNSRGKVDGKACLERMFD